MLLFLLKRVSQKYFKKLLTYPEMYDIIKKQAIKACPENPVTGTVG